MRTLIGVAILGVLAAGCGQADTEAPPAPAEPPPLPTQAPDLKGDPAPPAVAAAPRSAEGYPIGDAAVKICKAAIEAKTARKPGGAALEEVRANMVILSWPDRFGDPIKYQCRVRTSEVDVGSVDLRGHGTGVRWPSNEQITYSVSSDGTVRASAYLYGKLMGTSTYKGR
jgi:hypothetical protein